MKSDIHILSDLEEVTIEIHAMLAEMVESLYAVTNVQLHFIYNASMDNINICILSVGFKINYKLFCIIFV